MLVRSRIFVEKYKEAIEYGKEGVKKFGEAGRTLQELIKKAEGELKKENKRIEEVSTMKSLQ